MYGTMSLFLLAVEGWPATTSWGLQ